MAVSVTRPPTTCPFTMNSTAPAGVPLEPVTSAVSVTAAPRTDGFGEAERVADEVRFFQPAAPVDVPVPGVGIAQHTREQWQRRLGALATEDSNERAQRLDVGVRAGQLLFGSGERRFFQRDCAVRPCAEHSRRRLPPCRDMVAQESQYGREFAIHTLTLVLRAVIPIRLNVGRARIVESEAVFYVDLTAAAGTAISSTLDAK